jgi:hypothetical protein
VWSVNVANMRLSHWLTLVWLATLEHIPIMVLVPHHARPVMLVHIQTILQYRVLVALSASTAPSVPLDAVYVKQVSMLLVYPPPVARLVLLVIMLPIKVQIYALHVLRENIRVPQDSQVALSVQSVSTLIVADFLLV